jgi:hypothetical protein
MQALIHIENRFFELFKLFFVVRFLVALKGRPINFGLPNNGVGLSAEPSGF